MANSSVDTFIPRSPEAIPAVQSHHLRRLERRCHYLLAEIAQHAEYPGRSYDRSESAALSAVLADFRERGYTWKSDDKGEVGR